MASPVTPPEFYERLERFARSTGMSINAFGMSAGFGSGTFSRVLRDQVSIGVHHVIHILRTYPDLNPQWLLLGEPPMLITQSERKIQAAKDKEMYRLIGENEALREVIEVWSKKLKQAGMHHSPPEEGQS